MLSIASFRSMEAKNYEISTKIAFFHYKTLTKLPYMFVKVVDHANLHKIVKF
jgi:hypothetical protein